VIKLDPGVLLRRAEVKLAVALVLGVNPNKSAAGDALLLQRFEFIQGRGAVARVGGDGQTAGQVCPGGGAHQFAMQVGKTPSIHANLDETRPDVCLVDPIPPLPKPARGELVGGLRPGVSRQELVVGRSVVTGICYFAASNFSITKAWDPPRS